MEADIGLTPPSTAYTSIGQVLLSVGVLEIDRPLFMAFPQKLFVQSQETETEA